MVLAAYAETLVDGQRVVVFGAADSGLAQHLLERGARLVHVYDPDPGRAAEAAARNRSQNLWFAPLGEGELALRERSFELGIIENIASHREPGVLLRRVRRVLSGRGALLVASPNPDVKLRLLPGSATERHALDYYALYDAVSEQFPHIRMLGQMPFVGYAVADFGTEREPEPTFDAGFVPGGAEEPEWFIVLASEHPLRLDEFAVVQLPFRGALGSHKTLELEQQLRSAQIAERRARERLAELESSRRRSPAHHPDAGSAQQDASELVSLRRELERREAWIRELEERAATADARADETQAELDEERERNAELRRQLDAERSRAQALEMDAARVKTNGGSAPEASTPDLSPAGTQAQQLLAERDGRIAELERTLGEREVQAAELRARVTELARSDDDDHAREVSGLEAQLAERGLRLRELERELREAERIGRELVRELESARQTSEPAEISPAPAQAQEDPRPPPSELIEKLDRLAALNAAREADLAAARWTIEQLESRLDEVPEAGANDLQRSLASAHAELQRQATLIEELKGSVATGEEVGAR